MALPLWVLKYLKLDYFWAVRACPHVAHIVLVIICDFYFWEIGKKVAGNNGARLAFLFLATNRFYNEFITRCFSNSIETIFQTIVFHYFLKVKNSFDLNVVILTAGLTVSFMIRNTSPIGWPPLLLYKILYDGSLVPFLLAGVFVFLPVVALFIFIDSFNYGFESFPVVTAYNFVKANLAEGLSKYFGVEPVHFYLVAVLPLIFLVLYPCLLGAFAMQARNWYRGVAGQASMLMTVLVGFYLLVFSLISHKEPRFLLPVVPLCFLLLGQFLASLIKQ